MRNLATMKPLAGAILLGVGLAVSGCGAGSEKLDPQFQKAFEDQGKRGAPGGAGGSAAGGNPSMRGQALPPGATPPPSSP